MKRDLERLGNLLLEDIDDELNLGDYTQQEILHQKAILLKTRRKKSRHYLIQSHDLLKTQANLEKK